MSRQQGVPENVIAWLLENREQLTHPILSSFVDLYLERLVAAGREKVTLNNAGVPVLPRWSIAHEAGSYGYDASEAGSYGYDPSEVAFSLHKLNNLFFEVTHYTNTKGLVLKSDMLRGFSGVLGYYNLFRYLVQPTPVPTAYPAAMASRTLATLWFQHLCDLSEPLTSPELDEFFDLPYWLEAHLTVKYKGSVLPPDEPYWFPVSYSIGVQNVSTTTGRPYTPNTFHQVWQVAVMIAKAEAKRLAAFMKSLRMTIEVLSSFSFVAVVTKVHYPTIQAAVVEDAPILLGTAKQRALTPREPMYEENRESMAGDEKDEEDDPRSDRSDEELDNTDKEKDAVEERDTDEEEEEDYADDPPIVTNIQPSYSADTAPGKKGRERHQPAQGKSRLGRDIQTGKYVDVPQASRRQGLYILGLQGYGKSGLMENLIIQDVKQGIGVGLLDPKGELTDNVIARLPDREKEQKVILLDITEKDFFPGLNLFACADPTSDREIQYTLNQVIHVFEKAFGITSLNPRLYDYLYNCAYTLIANPGYTMMDIRLLLTNPTFRSTLLGNVTDPVVLDFWQKYYNPLPERQQREEAREILRRLNDLSHDPLRYIIGQAQSTINLQQIMDEGKILLVKLNSKRFEQATRLIGSIIVALILNASDVRQTKKQFNLYADEFQRFATEDFATLIEEARYAGIGIAMAHQNRGQLELTEKQADTNLKQRTLSVGNLVVFRAPTDADGLAGQFTQEPDAAWVQVNRPQEHERIEEQVEVEVEDDIEEIAQNPVDYLIGGRGTHGSPRVREAIHVIPHVLTKQEQSRRLGNHSEDVKNPLNALLVDAMEKRVKIKSDDFCLRIEEIVREGFQWRKSITPDQRRIIFEQRQSEFIRGLLYYQDDPAIWEQQRTEVIEVYIAWYLYEKGEGYRYYKPEDYYHAPKYSKGQHSGGYPEKTDEEVKNFMNSLEREIRSQRHTRFNEWMETLDEITTFVTNFTILCEELAADPIKVPTGKKRLVKRKQPSIHYLPLESERITHQQPSEQEMTNRMVRELINLPLYTARVKITTATGIEEHLIRTLEPEKGIRGTALQARIERIQEHNRTPDERGIRYCRLRQEVETEIRQRQEQDGEQPEEPPILRHPPR